MLGRKDFTKDELRAARAAVDAQVAAYHQVSQGSADAGAEAAIFNGLLLGLDRRFVHRVRMVTGKAGTPLNEAELLVDGLMNNDGVLRESTVIQYVADQSVLGIKPGERIALTADQFATLAAAMFDELEEKFAG